MTESKTQTFGIIMSTITCNGIQNVKAIRLETVKRNKA